MGIKDFFERKVSEHLRKEKPLVFTKRDYIKSEEYKNRLDITKLESSIVGIVENSAFEGCEKLESVHLENVRRIYNNAFKGCTGLKTVYIPGIQIVYEGVFEGCENLEKIFVSKEEECEIVYKCLPISMRESVRMLIGEEDIAVEWNNFILKHDYRAIYFKESLSEVLDGMFKGDKNEIRLIGGKCVEKIGDGAFKDYQELIEPRLPNVQEIGNNAFENCAKLQEVNFPKATKIGDGAFIGCTDLRKIDIISAEIIGDNVFDGCTGLKLLKLKNEEKALEVYNKLPTDLKEKVNIKEGGNRLAVCVGEDQKEVDLDTLKRSYECDSSNNTFEWSDHTELPQTITEIRKDMINGHEDKIQVVKGESVKEIKEEAFKGCMSLVAINFPNAIRICDEAFRDCNNLNLLILGDIECVGNDAFEGCDDLEKVHIAGEKGYDLIRDKLPTESKVFVNGKEMSKEINPSVAELENGGPVILAEGEVKEISKDLFKNVDNVSDITSIIFGSLSDDLVIKDGTFEGLENLSLVIVDNDPGERNYRELEKELKDMKQNVEIRIDNRS